MKGDQMGILAGYPTQRELPLSNQTRFKMGERALRRLLIIGPARWPAGPRARAFRLARGWGACSPASRRCWCGWRWPTRWPGSSGRCWPRVACIELRLRRCRRRHDREAVEEVGGSQERDGATVERRDLENQLHDKRF